MRKHFRQTRRATEQVAESHHQVPGEYQVAESIMEAFTDVRRILLIAGLLSTAISAAAIVSTLFLVDRFDLLCLTDVH